MTLLSIYSCKNQDKNLIVGKWRMSRYYEKQLGDFSYWVTIFNTDGTGSVNCYNFNNNNLEVSKNFSYKIEGDTIIEFTNTQSSGKENGEWKIFKLDSDSLNFSENGVFCSDYRIK